MRHESPSLVHLMHADAFARLPLTWASESACHAPCSSA
ncbi:hypothetical protein ID866_13365 [Astraeus odoratus]|nr:hypothetical protein ID866_13365 [Astraeus odoratus]